MGRVIWDKTKKHWWFEFQRHEVDVAVLTRGNIQWVVIRQSLYLEPYTLIELYFLGLATVLIFIRKGLFHWSVPKVYCKNNSVICSAKYLFYRWKNKTKPNRTKKEKYRWEVREKEKSLFDTHIHVRFSYLIIKERTEIVKNLLKPKYCCIQPSKKGFTINAVIAILS